MVLYSLNSILIRMVLQMYNSILITHGILVIKHVELYRKNYILIPRDALQLN